MTVRSCRFPPFRISKAFEADARKRGTPTAVGVAFRFRFAYNAGMVFTGKEQHEKTSV